MRCSHRAGRQTWVGRLVHPLAAHLRLRVAPMGYLDGKPRQEKRKLSVKLTRCAPSFNHALSRPVAPTCDSNLYPRRLPKVQTASVNEKREVPPRVHGSISDIFGAKSTRRSSLVAWLSPILGTSHRRRVLSKPCVNA